MKIGLLGYGKMGKAIESLANSQQFSVVWALGSKNIDQLSPELVQKADVVIEFTRPEAAFQNVMFCLKAGVPVVSGTTGWSDALPEAQRFCAENNGALLWASNFSIGVNLFFALNQYLARLMAQAPEYQPGLMEWHHIHKLDAPSGTAISLLEGILPYSKTKTAWALHPAQAETHQIPVFAYREGEIPGTHLIRWDSPVDTITIEHKAHTRIGFAWGAVLAARWLIGKKGIFTMADVLGIA